MKKGKLLKKLRDSPINYFSDLFIVAMVAAWVAVIAVMLVMAVYSTIKNCDNSIWGDLGILVAAPLSAGGAIWMVKNSVQHAIANKGGKLAQMDFPAVNAPEEDGGAETPMGDHIADISNMMAGEENGTGSEENKESGAELG